ncbi:MAG: UDP-N-acetylmuramate dehydrogenase [Deltaproteobacteria bacterium]|nr:UDP-N-acetylmuramate dehydrogenase [Deltaproteobacteria bacterium]
MTELPLQEHPSLADRTTLAVGGPARYWLDAADSDTVVGALKWAEERDLPVAVLGGGSNVLVADRGFGGLVLRVRAAERRTLPAGDDVLVDVGAGHDWDELTAWAVNQDLAGLECLAGIPGDVGAAPIQNVGAYGQEVGDCLVHVEAIERATGTQVVIDRASCALGYRQSVFKAAWADRYVVVGVRLRLRRGGEPGMAYPGVERALGGQRPTLKAVRAAVLALRKDKSMVLSTDDENRRSAGSFFVNPTVTDDRAHEVAELARQIVGPGESMPAHPSPDGRIKLSAAWLIERSGLPKGTVRGRVGLSTRHCLAIVNRGGATAAEVVAFAAEVRARVRDRFTVALEPEPRLIGFEPDETAALLDG